MSIQMRKTDYEYFLERQKDALSSNSFPFITCDSNHNLLTYDDIPIGARLRFKPSIMELFNEYLSSFSPSFVEKYGDGIFEMAPLQAYLFFFDCDDDFTPNLISLSMTDLSHFPEFLGFCNKYQPKCIEFRDFSYSPLRQYITLPKECFDVLPSFKPATIPTSL